MSDTILHLVSDASPQSGWMVSGSNRAHNRDEGERFPLFSRRPPSSHLLTTESGVACTPGTVTWMVAIEPYADTSAYQFLSAQAAHEHLAAEVPADLPGIAADVLTLGAFVADDEGFEDGAVNRFYESVLDFVGAHGGPAVRALESQMHSQDEIVQGWLIRYLAEVQTPGSYHERLELARNALRSKHPSVRHAAAMALATMGTCLTTEDLREAIAREHWQGVRRGMETALRFLTQRA